MMFLVDTEDEDAIDISQTLDNIAQYCREQGRSDYAVRLEEIRDVFR